MPSIHHCYLIHLLFKSVKTSDSKRNDEQAQSLKEEGNDYFKKGDFFKSEELYSQSISMYPTSVCYGNRSFAHYKLQNFKSSLEDATKSVQLDRNYSKGYYRRAEAHMALQNYELAIADFEQSDRIQPNRSLIRKLNECKRKQSEIFKEKGNTILKAGDYEKSIHLYTKSINMYATSHCYGNRSLAHYKMQNFENAIDDATNALRCDENYCKGYLRRADAYVALQNYDYAIKDYKSFLTWNSNDSRIVEKISVLEKMISTGEKNKLV